MSHGARSSTQSLSEVDVDPNQADSDLIEFTSATGREDYQLFSFIEDELPAMSEDQVLLACQELAVEPKQSTEGAVDRSDVAKQISRTHRAGNSHVRTGIAAQLSGMHGGLFYGAQNVSMAPGGLYVMPQPNSSSGGMLQMMPGQVNHGRRGQPFMPTAGMTVQGMNGVAPGLMIRQQPDSIPGKRNGKRKLPTNMMPQQSGLPHQLQPGGTHFVPASLPMGTVGPVGMPIGAMPGGMLPGGTMPGAAAAISGAQSGAPVMGLTRQSSSALSQGNSMSVGLSRQSTSALSQGSQGPSPQGVDHTLPPGAQALPSMAFALKQGKEGSRDGGKVGRHPTWIRSNMRATWGHLCLTCSSQHYAEALEALIQRGIGFDDNVSASLTFELLYENCDQVKLLEKKGGNLADKIKLILPAGNVDQGLPIPSSSLQFHTHFKGTTPNGTYLPKEYLQFDHMKFPWNSEKKQKGIVDHNPCTVEIGIKFATNVTTRAHGKRRFTWRVHLRMYGPDGRETLHHIGRCPVFSYLPRNPEKNANEFRVDDVVSDGKAGDLMVLCGAGLGNEHRPHLVARLVGAEMLTLPRLMEHTKSTFVTRLPETITPGEYTVQVVNDDNEEEMSCETKLSVTAIPPSDAPAAGMQRHPNAQKVIKELDAWARQLEEEHTKFQRVVSEDSGIALAITRAPRSPSVSRGGSSIKEPKPDGTSTAKGSESTRAATGSPEHHTDPHHVDPHPHAPHAFPQCLIRKDAIARGLAQMNTDAVSRVQSHMSHESKMSLCDILKFAHRVHKGKHEDGDHEVLGQIGKAYSGLLATSPLVKATAPTATGSEVAHYTVDDHDNPFEISREDSDHFDHVAHLPHEVLKAASETSRIQSISKVAGVVCAAQVWKRQAGLKQDKTVITGFTEEPAQALQDSKGSVRIAIGQEGRRAEILHTMAALGETEAVKAILTEHGQHNLNTRSSSGHTALQYALINGHEDVALTLLEAGAEDPWAVQEVCIGDPPNEVLQSPKGTALHRAVVLASPAVAKALLTRKPELALVHNAKNETPLHVAARVGQSETTTLLLNSARSLAKLEQVLVVQDAMGDTALHNAAAGSDREGLCAQQFIQASANLVNVTNNSGQTPLHMAASHGMAHVASLLLKSGADATIPDFDGLKPARLAHIHGHWQLAGILAQAHVDHITNSGNGTNVQSQSQDQVKPKELSSAGLSTSCT